MRKGTPSIKKISWKTIYLYVELEEYEKDLAGQYRYFLQNKKGKQYPLELRDRTLVFNLVNVPQVHVLPSDRWYFFCEEKQSQEIFPLELQPACGYELENLDKIFRYASLQCAYLASFGLVSGKTMQEMTGRGEETEKLFLYLQTDYMRKNKFQNRHDPFAEAKNVKTIPKEIVVGIMKKLLNAVYQTVCRFCRHDGRHVLFLSETRVPISGNLKALDDRIHERGLDKKLHLSYSFSRTMQQSLLKTAGYWLRLLFLIPKQDFIFVDDYVPIFQSIRLRPETKLIQLWHAGVGFKSVGYARFGKEGTSHPTDSCHRRYDYAIVGARGLIPVYEEVFGIPGERILPYGLPRLDGYLDPEKKAAFRQEFYKKYPQLEMKKLILFAPTFRGKGQKDAFYPWEKIDLEKAYDFCADRYVFAIKMHPFVKDVPEIPEKWKDRIVDLSSEKDINALFYVTDILITDYSSNIYEFSLHDKPMIFYAFDKDVYQLVHGVHRTLEEAAPGKICATFDEVLTAIRKEDFCPEKRKRFIQESFDPQEALACDRIIDEIIFRKN